MLDSIEIYQFKVHLKNISPMIWRRFLIQSTSTLQDLHYVIQIIMGWTDYHLNEFGEHPKPGAKCFYNLSFCI